METNVATNHPSSTFNRLNEKCQEICIIANVINAFYFLFYFRNENCIMIAPDNRTHIEYHNERNVTANRRRSREKTMMNYYRGVQFN